MFGSVDFLARTTTPTPVFLYSSIAGVESMPPYAVILSRVDSKRRCPEQLVFLGGEDF